MLSYPTSPTKLFNMERRLSQRDPLSPFLFVLIAVSNKMLEKAKGSGLIEGLRIGRNSIKLSNLQFADDMILFYLTKEEILYNFKRILDCFGLMSSLKINYNKLALISCNCSKD